MSLTICPDCNSSVSQKAKACPKCGRPMNSAFYGVAILFFSIIILVGLYLAFNMIVAFPGLLIGGVGAIGLLVTIVKKFSSI